MTKKDFVWTSRSKGQALKNMPWTSSSKQSKLCLYTPVNWGVTRPPTQSTKLMRAYWYEKQKPKRLRALTFLILTNSVSATDLSYFHTALFPSLGALFPSLGLEDQNYRQNYMCTYFKLVRKFSGAIVRTKLACKVI